MRWYDASKHKPFDNTYCIARMRSDFENSNDIIYKGILFANEDWVYDEEDKDGLWSITHFIIPAAIWTEN